mgnify:CR=1 FL=1
MTRSTFKALIPFGILCTLSLMACGCGSYHGLARPLVAMEQTGFIEDRKQAARLEKAMTDDEIARLLDVDVRAKLPTSLAVAKLSSHCRGYQPRLDRITAEELAQWQDIVKDEPSILGVQPISNLTFGNEIDTPNLTLRSLRVAAARMGCELLLVHMQGDDDAENFNDAAVLYWTFVGLWIVPGTTVEHWSVMQAVVVDSRTGMILGTAGGDCHLKRHCTAAATDIARSSLACEAPTKALADLQTGCDRVLRQVIAKADRRRTGR